MPTSIRASTAVRNAEDEVTGIVEDFIGFDFRFEIKGAETALLTSGSVDFGIDIKDSAACFVDKTEVWVAGALELSVSRPWKFAAESIGGIEFFAQKIFDMPADFIDAADRMDRMSRVVEFVDEDVGLLADYLKDCCGRRIVQIDRKNRFSRYCLDQVSKRNLVECLAVAEEPVDESPDFVFFRKSLVGRR